MTKQSLEENTILGELIPMRKQTNKTANNHSTMCKGRQLRMNHATEAVKRGNMIRRTGKQEQPHAIYLRYVFVFLRTMPVFSVDAPLIGY